MKTQIAISILRIILTAWLIYLVYIEAGLFTALSILLIGVSVELQSITLKAHLFSIQKITKFLFKDKQ